MWISPKYPSNWVVWPANRYLTAKVNRKCDVGLNWNKIIRMRIQLLTNKKRKKRKNRGPKWYSCEKLETLAEIYLIFYKVRGTGDNSDKVWGELKRTKYLKLLWKVFYTFENWIIHQKYVCLECIFGYYIYIYILVVMHIFFLEEMCTRGITVVFLLQYTYFGGDIYLGDYICICI